MINTFFPTLISISLGVGYRKLTDKKRFKKLDHFKNTNFYFFVIQWYIFFLL